MTITERPAGLSEAILLASHIELAGTTQSVMVVELHAPVPAPAIVGGLREVFRRQPMLRARLAGRAPRWRFAFDARFADVGITATELGSRSPAELFAAECDNVLDLRKGPLWRVLLGVGRPGEVTVLVVTFAHAIVDGQSGFAFTRQLLGATAGRTADGEPFPPRPALEDALRPTPENVQAPAAAEGAQPAPFPIGQWPFEKVVAFEDRRTNVVLSQVEAEVMQPILRRCRSAGVKVDAFFTAAVQAALAGRNPNATSLPIVGAFDVRGAMEPIIAPDEIGMFMKDIQLSDTAWPSDGMDLWERAKGISESIARERGRQLARPAEQSIEDACQQVTDAAKYPLTAFPFSFSVSNMGRQGFAVNSVSDVKSIYLSSTDRFGIMGFQVVLAGVRDSVHLAFVHTCPLVSPKTITQLRDDLAEILRSEARADAPIRSGRPACL